MTDLMDKVTNKAKAASDTIVENWEVTKKKMKSAWHKVTDTELHKTEGKKNKILGLLQEKYGCTLEKAQKMYDDLKK